MLTDAQITMMITDLTEWAGVVPPNPQALRDIVETEPRFVEKVQEFYPNGGDGMDTAERDSLIDIVAMHFTGRGWPVNGESGTEAPARFEATMRKATAAEGWTLRWDNA